jgi:adhesin transport system outer membrane protein
VVTSNELSQIEDYPVRESSQVLIKQALQNSPTKQKLTYTALASKAEMDVQSSSLYPEVYARAEQQYGNYVYAGTEPVGRFFIGVQSSFGAGLSSVSRVDAARAKIKAAESELVTNERTISEQITTEWSNVKNVRMRLASLKQAQKASEDIRESWDRQFVTGRKTWLDVMNAAKELAQTELQLAEAQASLIVSSWRIAILTQQLNTLVQR